jgi:hypothetical protein
LHGLKSLRLHRASSIQIAAQLTGLTSITVVTDDFEKLDPQAVYIAARNPGLQSATFFGYGVAVQDLQQLLLNCRHLTHLDLHNNTIDQPLLDDLLEHGISITSLKVRNFELTASRVDRPCSWSSLHLKCPEPSLIQFAFLPIKGVDGIICTTRTDMPGDTVDHALNAVRVTCLDNKLPGVTLNDQITLLRQAASNLALCPAVSRQPVRRIHIAVSTSSPVSQTGCCSCRHLHRWGDLT